MIRTPPDAQLEVRMLPGARQTATPANTYGCIMEVDGIALDVRLRVDLAGPLRPGVTSDIGVHFLSPDLARLHVFPGMPFRLRETEVIAEGEVKSTRFGPPARRVTTAARSGTRRRA